MAAFVPVTHLGPPHHYEAKSIWGPRLGAFTVGVHWTWTTPNTFGRSNIGGSSVDI